MTEFKPNETMLQNYIQNKLSPNDTEQLELWLADHSEVMQDLEMDVIFSQADYQQASQPENSRKSPFNFLDFFTSKKLVPVHILAYGLVALFLFNNLTNTQNISDYSAATFIELEKQRGADPEPIEVPISANKSIVLRFFPDSLTEKYSLVLQSKSSDQMIKFQDLKADDYGAITLSINSNTKLLGMWEFNVYNDTEQLEQNYLIEIK